MSLPIIADPELKLLGNHIHGMSHPFGHSVKRSVRVPVPFSLCKPKGSTLAFPVQESSHTTLAPPCYHLAVAVALELQEPRAHVPAHELPADTLHTHARPGTSCSSPWPRPPSTCTMVPSVLYCDPNSDGRLLEFGLGPLRPMWCKLLIPHC